MEDTFFDNLVSLANSEINLSIQTNGDTSIFGFENLIYNYENTDNYIDTVNVVDIKKTNNSMMDEFINDYFLILCFVFIAIRLLYFLSSYLQKTKKGGDDIEYFNVVYKKQNCVTNDFIIDDNGSVPNSKCSGTCDNDGNNNVNNSVVDNIINNSFYVIVFDYYEFNIAFCEMNNKYFEHYGETHCEEFSSMMTKVAYEIMTENKDDKYNVKTCVVAGSKMYVIVKTTSSVLTPYVNIKKSIEIKIKENIMGILSCYTVNMCDRLLETLYGCSNVYYKDIICFDTEKQQINKVMSMISLNVNNHFTQYKHLRYKTILDTEEMKTLSYGDKQRLFDMETGIMVPSLQHIIPRCCVILKQHINEFGLSNPTVIFLSSFRKNYYTTKLIFNDIVDGKQLFEEYNDVFKNSLMATSYYSIPMDPTGEYIWYDPASNKILSYTNLENFDAYDNETDNNETDDTETENNSTHKLNENNSDIDNNSTHTDNLEDECNILLKEIDSLDAIYYDTKNTLHCDPMKTSDILTPSDLSMSINSCIYILKIDDGQIHT